MDWKDVGYWSLYLVPGGPLGLFVYESFRSKEKRNDFRMTSSAIATASFILKLGLGFGAYQTLPEKYQIFDKKENDAKTIEQKVNGADSLSVDKTYFYKTE